MSALRWWWWKSASLSEDEGGQWVCVPKRIDLLVREEGLGDGLQYAEQDILAQACRRRTAGGRGRREEAPRSKASFRRLSKKLETRCASTCTSEHAT